MDDLVAIVRRFRRTVQAEAFEYIHLTGLSGKTKREQNREFLILAQGDK